MLFTSAGFDVYSLLFKTPNRRTFVYNYCLISICASFSNKATKYNSEERTSRLMRIMGNQGKHTAKYSVCVGIQCQTISAKFEFF